MCLVCFILFVCVFFFKIGYMWICALVLAKAGYQTYIHVSCVFFSLLMCVCLWQSWLSVYVSLPKWSISGCVCLCVCQSGVSDGYPMCLSFVCVSWPKSAICVCVSLCLPKWSIRRIRSCILLPPSVSPLTTGQSKVHQWHCHCCHWSHIRWKVVSFQDKKGECFVRLVFVLIVISASGCRSKSLYSLCVGWVPSSQLPTGHWMQKMESLRPSSSNTLASQYQNFEFPSLLQEILVSDPITARK